MCVLTRVYREVGVQKRFREYGWFIGDKGLKEVVGVITSTGEKKVSRDCVLDIGGRDTNGGQDVRQM